MENFQKVYQASEGRFSMNQMNVQRTKKLLGAIDVLLKEKNEFFGDPYYVDVDRGECNFFLDWLFQSRFHVTNDFDAVPG